MWLTYDAKANAAYVYLVDRIAPGGVSHTVPLDSSETGEMINLDFDAEGHLLGIEVLEASTRLTLDVLQAAQRID